MLHMLHAIQKCFICLHSAHNVPGPVKPSFNMQSLKPVEFFIRYKTQ